MFYAILSSKFQIPSALCNIIIAYQGSNYIIKEDGYEQLGTRDDSEGIIRSN